MFFIISTLLECAMVFDREFAPSSSNGGILCGCYGSPSYREGLHLSRPPCFDSDHWELEAASLSRLDTAICTRRGSHLTKRHLPPEIQSASLREIRSLAHDGQAATLPPALFELSRKISRILRCTLGPVSSAYIVPNRQREKPLPRATWPQPRGARPCKPAFVQTI